MSRRVVLRWTGNERKRRDGCTGKATPLANSVEERVRERVY
jgi:hypothetical protein